MDDMTRGLLIGGFFSLASVLIPLFINSRKIKADAKKALSESDSIDADTMTKLSKQVNTLVTDNETLFKRVGALETELRRVYNAYARAIRFIQGKLPGVEVPDFLLDTGQHIKK